MFRFYRNAPTSLVSKSDLISLLVTETQCLTPIIKGRRCLSWDYSLYSPLVSRQCGMGKKKHLVVWEAKIGEGSREEGGRYDLPDYISSD